MSETVSGEPKTIGIISYLTLIGWIIALVMHNSNKSDFGAFHIRQSLGLIILYIVVWIVNFVIAVAGIPYLGWLLLLPVFVLWILGVVAAVQGEKKPVPVLGEHFQEWFKGIG